MLGWKIHSTHADTPISYIFSSQHWTLMMFFLIGPRHLHISSPFSFPSTQDETYKPMRSKVRDWLVTWPWKHDFLPTTVREILLWVTLPAVQSRYIYCPFLSIWQLETSPFIVASYMCIVCHCLQITVTAYHTKSQDWPILWDEQNL